VVNIPFINYLAEKETNLGILNSPPIIFLYNADVFGSSKGKYPHNIAYSITPQDQISAIRPSYFFPAIISGAA
jgi:hypothetical protein